MKSFCIHCGTQLIIVAGKRPNFCHSCGEAQGSLVKKPAPSVRRAPQPDPEDEEDDEEFEEDAEFTPPTDIKVQIIGVPNASEGVSLRQLIGTSQSSEKVHRRPVSQDRTQRLKQKTHTHSIEIAV